MAFSKKKKYNEDDRVSTMIEHSSLGDRIVDVIVILLCALVAFCSIIPMWHVLMSSFSEGQALLSKEGLVLWPVGEFNLEGYAHIFKDTSIIDGYAISRQTRLKTPMILFLTATMLFSGGMVPLYMVINALGWVETPLALVIPGCTNGMFSIMMMNAFNSVLQEMYEAARIDGAGHFTTEFVYSGLLIAPESADPQDTVEITVEIENTGKVKGDEVVQLYLRDVYAGMTRPIKELAGFKRITLEPGEKRKVVFRLQCSQTAFLDSRMQWKVEKGEFEVQIGSSSEDIRQKGSFRIAEERTVEGKSRGMYADAKVR